MSLYIVQHGKSLSKEIDPEKSISQEGKKDTSLIANVAKGYNVEVSDILHSGKKRAIQTAEIFSSILDINGRLEETSGLNPMDDVKEFAKNKISNNNLMIVGHLPFLEKLISFLVAGSEDLVVFKLQNSGVVCLDQNKAEGSWFIKWALMPHIS